MFMEILERKKAFQIHFPLYLWRREDEEDNFHNDPKLPQYISENEWDC